VFAPSMLRPLTPFSFLTSRTTRIAAPAQKEDARRRPTTAPRLRRINSSAAWHWQVRSKRPCPVAVSIQTTSSGQYGASHSLSSPHIPFPSERPMESGQWTRTLIRTRTEIIPVDSAKPGGTVLGPSLDPENFAKE
jgi:hypothetical protein